MKAFFNEIGNFHVLTEPEQYCNMLSKYVTRTVFHSIQQKTFPVNRTGPTRYYKNVTDGGDKWHLEIT